jgi:branched-chain amino acid transport system ATP-binding protein
MPDILTVTDLRVDIGEVCVVRNATMSVSEGEGVALLGANGAGKTTLISALTGTRLPAGGSVVFEGQDITRWSPERRVCAGLVLVPQGRMLFADLTVEENLRVGAGVKRPAAISSGDWERVHALFPPLMELAGRKAGSLSGGEQQMAAVGRALLARPRLLVLDEPSLGLSPKMVERLYNALREIRNAGVSVLVVEQLVGQALRLTERAHVLQQGELSYAGKSSELIHSDRFIADYFGG